MNLKCPHCGSDYIEEHELGVGDFHWYLCRMCGQSWSDISDTDVSCGTITVIVEGVVSEEGEE